MGIKQEVEGTKHQSKKYGVFEIIEYNHTENVKIRFINTGYCYTVTMCNIRTGLVKDHSIPTVCGRGYCTGGYLKGRTTDKRLAKARSLWDDMLQRCYGKNRSRTKTYNDCEVSEEWLDFSNFLEWYLSRCTTDEILEYNLDKDLCYSGNKIYSPDHCFLVPRKINNLIPSRVSTKMTNLPRGVHLHKGCGKYQAYCNNEHGSRVPLGFHETAEEAFLIHKNFKEKVIKIVADEFKETIDSKLYEILTNYNIEWEKD